MESLISCVPRSFLSSIQDDDEVAIVFLKELWVHIVGQELARNSEPANLVDKALEIRVSSPVWAKQLRTLQNLLIRSINRFWGVRLVETIRLDIGLSR
jgi:predicted nucleic acid-binding Zn ribbon protein